LAESRLAELAIHERGLDSDAPLDVLEDEAVAMRPKHDAKTGAHVVNIVPAPQLPASKRGTELLSGPAGEAVDPVVGFAVRCSLGHFLTIAHSGLKRREAELRFQDTPRGEELLVVPGWRVNPKGFRMDLVDSHMHMLVVFVVVAGGDVLVAGKPQSLHKAFYDTPEFFRVEASVFGMKGDDQVISAVATGAGVLRVHGLDELAGELEVFRAGNARKIGGQEPRRPRLVASTPNVVRELAKAFVRRRGALVPDDHRCPARRFTARLTWMMESQSSRFKCW
jgi:hypothetical protein